MFSQDHQLFSMVWHGQNGKVRHWFQCGIPYPDTDFLCECMQITACFLEGSDRQAIYLSCRSSSESGEPEQVPVLIVVVHSKLSLALLTAKEIQDKLYSLAFAIDWASTRTATMSQIMHIELFSCNILVMWLRFILICKLPWRRELKGQIHF